MSRDNKKTLLKKWNISSRRKERDEKREKRVKHREIPRRKTWGAEPSSYDEFPLRIA